MMCIVDLCFGVCLRKGMICILSVVWNLSLAPALARRSIELILIEIAIDQDDISLYLQCDKQVWVTARTFDTRRVWSWYIVVSIWLLFYAAGERFDSVLIDLAWLASDRYFTATTYIIIIPIQITGSISSYTISTTLIFGSASMNLIWELFSLVWIHLDRYSWR